MKWVSLVLVLMGLLAPLWVQAEENPDYTSRYAQLASPIPAGVDISELLDRLTASHMH